MSGRKKKKRNDPKPQVTGLFGQDENFYFIVGYTDGGFPYGITWEEYEAEQLGKSGETGEVGGKPMKELILTKQQLQEIVNTYDMFMEEMESYLNIETGEVVTLRRYNLDEEEEELSELIEEGFNEIYFRIPDRESNEGYTDMFDFAETVEDKKLQSTLLHILSGGKRIFRRFKDALSSDSREIARYYEFVEKQNRARIMEWLDSIGVQAIIED